MRWVRSLGRVELSPNGRPERLLGTAQDITVQKVAEDSLAHQALHDPLSGLPNRLLFLDRLGQALKRLARRPSTVGVIYLDLDNDSLGYAVGDHLLLAMATRLAGLVRPGDTLARIGGDDFAMVCDALSDESGVVAVAERVRASMTEPIQWDGGDLVLSAGAGVALDTSASDSPDLLLRDAEAAMYRAKNEGRARSAVFAETMRVKAMGRLDTELALRQSIKRGDLRVRYQPIVTLVDEQVPGNEALVRWAHPTRGLLGPDEFITIAEETGLIVPLGTWVLQEACRQGGALSNSRCGMVTSHDVGQLVRWPAWSICPHRNGRFSSARLRPQTGVPPARDDRERPHGRRSRNDHDPQVTERPGCPSRR